MVQDALDMGSLLEDGDELWFFGLGVTDAFHQLPLRQNEWKFTAVSFGGKFCIFEVLVFGSGSAPTV